MNSVKRLLWRLLGLEKEVLFWKQRWLEERVRRTKLVAYYAVEPLKEQAVAEAHRAKLELLDFYKEVSP